MYEEDTTAESWAADRDIVPAVSVIVVNYNSGSLLTACVRSVLRSTAPVEVLVSDNASSDRSLEILQSAVDGDSRVRVFRNSSNLGFALGNNVVLPYCRGQYLLFLNPDCEIQPDTIGRMLAAMAAHPEAGMAGCMIRNPDGSEQPGCRRYVPTPWRALMRVLRLSHIGNHPRLNSFLLTGEPIPPVPTPVEAISGAFMFVRRSAVEQVGPLDEDYFLHCEDLDWCMRFKQAGLPVLFVPDVEIVHVKGGSGGTPVVVEWHKHRGMIRFYRKFFRKRYPWPLLYLVILAVWTRFLLIAARIGLKGSIAAHSRKMADSTEPVTTLRTGQNNHSPRPAVVVTGATSQIGCYLIPRLIQGGYAVHAISRNPPRNGAEGPLLMWQRIDITRDPAALSGLERATALIHLAPLATLPALINGAARAGVRRIVAFGSTSRYTKVRSTDRHERQWVAELVASESALETMCAEHGVAWTLFRPTLIYGRGMDKNVTVIADFIRRFGFFPIVGDGTGLRRPVHADDLAAACVAVLDRQSTFNKAYNLSGAEAITYRQMVEAIFAGLGRRPRIVRIPISIFTLLLRVGAWFPTYRHLNPEMVMRINRDMDFDHLEASRDFEYAPRKFVFGAEPERDGDVRPAAIG